jgi:hypothetical protein
MRQADLDESRRSDGLSSAERDELVRLRRELRVAKLKSEILMRAGGVLRSEERPPKMMGLRVSCGWGLFGWCGAGRVSAGAVRGGGRGVRGGWG